MKFINFFLSFLFLAPTFLSVAQYFFGRKESEKNLIHVNCVGTFMATLIFSGLFLETSILSSWNIKLFSVHSLDIHWGGEINTTSSLFLLMGMWLNLFCKLLVVQFSLFDSSSQSRFFFYTDFFLLGLFIAVSANYFFPLMIGLEIVGFMSYLLLSFSYENNTTNQVAFTAFLYDQVGSLLLLFAGGLMIFFHGDISFSSSEWSLINQSLIGVLFFIAIGIKLFQFGFNSWASRSSEIPFCSLALVVNAMAGIPAFILLWRLHLLEVSFLKSATLYWGISTCFLASGASFMKPSLKEMLSCLTVAYGGLLFAFSTLGLYEITLSFVVVLSFIQFMGFGLERIFSLHRDTIDSKLDGDVYFERFLRGNFLAVFILWSLFHAGLMWIMGLFVEGSQSPSLWMMGACLLFLTMCTWRPVFLLLKKGSLRRPHPSEQDLFDGNKSSLKTSFFIWLCGASILGLFIGLGLFLKPHMRQYFSSITYSSLWIGTGIVFSGVNVFLLKDFGVRKARNGAKMTQIIDQQGSLEILYYRMFVKPFKWISSSFSEKIDQSLIEEKAFSGSIYSLSKMNQFIEWVQMQAFSVYMLSLLFGVMSLLFFFMLK